MHEREYTVPKLNPEISTPLGILLPYRKAWIFQWAVKVRILGLEAVREGGCFHAFFSPHPQREITTTTGGANSF